MDAATVLKDAAKVEHVRGVITKETGRTEPPVIGAIIRIETPLVSVICRIGFSVTIRCEILIGFINAQRKDFVLRWLAAFGAIFGIIRILIGNVTVAIFACSLLLNAAFKKSLFIQLRNVQVSHVTSVYS